MKRRIIRKVSVGTGFPDKALHYQAGKSIILNRKSYKIIDIELSTECLSLGNLGYDIYVIDESVDKPPKVLWKTVVDVPIVVEYDIDFD